MNTNMINSEYSKCNGECKECENKEKAQKRTCNTCYISTENSTHTRRCFITGEYCSQKTNIQREKNKLYRKKSGEIEITAFVIMNFSDMSDVVYRQRIKKFTKSLKKYLYMDVENSRLYCSVSQNCEMQGMKQIEKINVVRSDSDPASNYVICSRICMQMQIADLIIVDVSLQNPNVFYEFGMAVALDKLILPICFSESFYEMNLPEPVRKEEYETRKELEHHIGCYPWRKTLFEYYGIRFRKKKNADEEGESLGTHYMEYKEVVEQEKYDFPDVIYNRFPYDEKCEENSKEKIGTRIYNKLRNQYNEAWEENNTLIVYTMEGYLNEEQAGLCIVNFYHTITERMQKEQCFCGERVGVLVQGQGIPENDKDAKRQRHLLYNVGEIIHIGVNQATYFATKEKAKSEEVLANPEYLFESGEEKGLSNSVKEIKRYVKEHVSNRSMIIYPDNPIYVERIKQFQSELISEKSQEKCDPLNAFCLYHVMLKTLRYTNEIVVDITNNNLQSLFWLGAAHGSEIYAVTVKHELSEKEKEIISINPKEINRNVFDVAGLWTAYYYSHDTEGFYQQLALAQFGIEKHSKIIPADISFYGLRKWEYFELDDYSDGDGDLFESKEERRNQRKLEIQKKEKLALESYYRRRFWNAMLRFNRLRIYISQRDDINTMNEDEPIVRAAKWDIDAVSALTHYLSKRSLIGEYVVITLPNEEKDEVAKKVNYICVGQPANPLTDSFPKYIYKKCKGYNGAKEHFEDVLKNKKCVYTEKIQVKGFSNIDQDSRDNKEGIYTYLPWSYCATCVEDVNKQKINETILTTFNSSTLEEECPLKKYSSHKEIAQLIFWREDEKKNRHFRVSIVGSSGPATFGLSSLFVDEEHKLCDFLEDIEENIKDCEKTLLYNLQSKVRKKIFRLLNKELGIEISNILKRTDADKDIQERGKYKNLVLYTVFSYLSTVVYQYFLPFLTEKDISRIYNGVYIFVNSMKAAKHSPFCLNYKEYVRPAEIEEYPIISDNGVDKLVEMIPEKVKIFLEKFKGIEAFYEVEVEHCRNMNSTEKNQNNIDTRKVMAIKEVSEEIQDIKLFMLSDDI